VFRLHYGEPDHPGALRFFQGTLLSKDRKSGRDCYLAHPIKWWLGVSGRGNRSGRGVWFFGLVRCDRVRDERYGRDNHAFAADVKRSRLARAMEFEQ